MVSSLVAPVPADLSGAAEPMLGPASGLVRRQLDGLAAVAEAAGTVVRAAQGVPSVAGAVAGLVALVVLSFVVAVALAGLAGLARHAGHVRRRPRAATA
jgi:hypothetical protein